MSESKKEIKPNHDNLPADIADLIYEDSGAGQENMTADDYAIPRLSILQSNSPQVEKRKEEYVDGAEASMIIDNIGNTLYDGEEGIIVVPINFRRTIIEWGMRSKGGGFINDHGYQPDLLKNAKLTEIEGKKYLLNDEGNQMVDTSEYFVYILDENGWSPAVISMASSQMKKSKRWNTLIESVKIKTKNGRINAASYYMSYKLTTVPENNEKGSWFGWQIKKNGATIDLEDGKDIYLAAREFHSQIRQGDVKVSSPVVDVSDSDDEPM